MEITVTIPEDGIEKIKALHKLRKDLVDAFENFKSNPQTQNQLQPISQAIQSVNLEVNQILLNCIYENKDWQTE